MPARTLLLAFLFGAVGGGLAAWVLSAVGGNEPATVAVEDVVRSEPDGAPAADPDLGPVLLGSPPAPPSDAAEGEALQERVAGLEAQMKDLVQRVAALDDRPGKPDFEALSDEELTARASSLYAFKNYAGTLEAYEALLARDPDLDVETRSRVLSTIAQCHRALGDTKKADEVFQQVEALHGEGTAGAMTARYQRAWLRHAQSDLEGARDFMRQVASSESSPTFWRLFSRANSADFSIRLGDTTHVRSDLEDFKAQLAGDDSPTGRRVLAYVNTLLERLDG